MKQRREVNKISAKRLAALGGKLPFSSITNRGGRIAVRARSRAEKERIYGTEDKISWMHAQRCIVFELSDGACEGPIEVMHTRSGGTGRKADAKHSCPACQKHHRHAHQVGAKTFAAEFGIDLDATAKLYSQRYQDERFSEIEE